MIPKPLSEFPKAFSMEGVQKEIFPYEFYTTKTAFDEEDYPLSMVVEHVPPKDREEFLKCHAEVVRAKCRNVMERKIYANMFHKKAYAEFYCNQDVRILRNGFMKYREVMWVIMELDTLMFLSLSSISDTFLIKRGSYENVYEISGMCRKFIQLCNKGGRVMCRDNDKQLVMGQLDYFDAVSLYPSAMERLKNDGYGIPAGVPKIIKDEDHFERLRNAPKSTTFFIKIQVVSVERELHMPIMSTIVKGIRDYSVRVGKEYFCDRIEFEDLLTFMDFNSNSSKGTTLITVT